MDKETSIVIVDGKDYVKKVSAMIGNGISQSKYADKTLQDLKHFQNFLCRHF